MKKKSLRHNLKMRGYEIISVAEKEVRALTEEEANELQKIIDELQKLNAKNELVDEFKAALDEMEEEPETEPEDEKPEDEVEENALNDEEEQQEEEPKEEEKSVDEEEEPETEEPKEEEETEEPSNEDEDNEEINDRSNINIMKKEKQFSLVKAIRAIANNKQLDEFTAAVISEGEKEARAAGVATQGQIQIPTQRSTVTVSSEGEDVVVTDIMDILTPLRAKNVLAQAGAKFMTGLVGDVQYPIMSGNNVGWEGEIGDADDADVSFSNVKLTPHRLTAYVDISKQMLAQDSIDVENTIRTDLINAINTKLEQTILGLGDGKEGGAVVIAPVGMLNTLTPTEVSDFAGICEVEADVEDANVLGECKYVMSNKTKAALRAMKKDSEGNGLVYAEGSVDGTPAFNTSNIPSAEGAKYYIYGDWSNLAIGSWAGIDITTDIYSRATAGQIRLVVNCFFDAKMLRPSAFAAGTIVEDDGSEG